MIITRAGDVQIARVTVLFADLRGYTALAETLPAARVVPLLNEFFRVLTSATTGSGGEIFHMAGDGIMAGFGLHDAGSEGASDALSAGHAILEGFEPIAIRWRNDLGVESGIGIGLHLGEVAVSAFGPSRRKSMTLIGDTVNVASRLCGRARAGEVLFSCTVAEAIAEQAKAGDATQAPAHDTASYLRLPQFELRGRREPIDIWCVPARERLIL